MSTEYILAKRIVCCVVSGSRLSSNNLHETASRWTRNALASDADNIEHILCNLVGNSIRLVMLELKLAKFEEKQHDDHGLHSAVLGGSKRLDLLGLERPILL